MVLMDRSRRGYLQCPTTRSLSRRGDIRQLCFARQHLQPIHQIRNFLQLREVALFRRVGEDDLACKFWLKSREGWIDLPEFVRILVSQSQTFSHRTLNHANPVLIPSD